MCTIAPFSVSRGHLESSEVQLPSLEGVKVPPLGEDLTLSCTSSFPRSCITRPSLCRIDTASFTGNKLHQDESIRPIGHKRQRSVDAFTSSSQSSPESLDSALTDAFFSPWSKQLDFTHEPPSASLTGLYISQSSRKDSSTVTARNSILPSRSALPSLDVVLNPPSPTFDPEETAESEEEPDSEDVWNLIPYDISWGPAYYGYSDGTLPGPDGKCIFLRSPTPLKYQRTGQACEKCRERKAKCSGSRPSCARCVMRGLTCNYASDTKQDKPDSFSHDKPSVIPVDLKPGHPTSSNQLDNPRIRRNTDCGSHGLRTSIQIRNTVLRRRHTTIGTTRSPQLVSESIGRQYRSGWNSDAAETSDTNGSPGPLLDASITLPGNAVKEDDLHVSESSRLPYQTLLRRPEPFTSQTSPASSRFDAAFCDGGSAVSRFYREPLDQSSWHTQGFACNGQIQTSDMLATDSHCFEPLEGRQIYPSTMPGITEQLLQLDATYSNGYEDRMLNDGNMQTYCTLAAGCEPLFDGMYMSYDYNMSDSSCADTSLRHHAPCQSAADMQTKTELLDYSMDTDAPHIALPCHSPDFYHFDHCEDARAMMALEVG